MQKELRQLGSFRKVAFKTDNLRRKTSVILSDTFSSPVIDAAWLDLEREIKQLNIPDGTGGVNFGDRRAIYYLICALKSRSALEIGTHLGASTVHIASAFRHDLSKTSRITTVDIADVNSAINKPWLKYGASFSPSEMIAKLNLDSRVEFIIGDSLDFLANCQQTFDFIFLDGDHSAVTVYQEISASLNLLKENGVILLHDYYPKMKPLWSNGIAKPGPFLAVERLRKEGVKVAVLPLGELPWETKLNSRSTSLALLLADA